MKRSFLVCYDIRDPKRLQKVYGIMRSYGEHLQYSVFLCELTHSLEQNMRTELHNAIDHDLDQILLIPLQHRVFFETLGTPMSSRDRELYLVTDNLDVTNKINTSQKEK